MTPCGRKSSRCLRTNRLRRSSSNVRQPPSSPARPADPMLNRQLGPYTIVAPLGAGGMGEVYRARDSKLGRDVAIKILPAHFTADPERRARFAREARTLATLNHPHIGAIYGLEDADGVTGIVLELVEGPTLADRLERGPLKIRRGAGHRAADRRRTERSPRARDHSSRSEAREHRAPGEDRSKPRRRAREGTRLRAGQADAGRSRRGPTAAGSGSFDGTADGRILGTPAYMSPEQARGLTVDKRTDIWAFGCVLFEMLTGGGRSRATRSPTRSRASSSTSPTGPRCRPRRPLESCASSSGACKRPAEAPA